MTSNLNHYGAARSLATMANKPRRLTSYNAVTLRNRIYRLFDDICGLAPTDSQMLCACELSGIYYPALYCMVAAHSYSQLVDAIVYDRGSATLGTLHDFVRYVRVLEMVIAIDRFKAREDSRNGQ